MRRMTIRSLGLLLSTLVLCCGWTALCLAQLPPPPVPGENPITPEKAVLGKILFWDEQLSSDNTVACGTCHRPGAAGLGGGGGSDSRRRRHPGPDLLFNTEDDTFGSPGIVRSDAKDLYIPDDLFDFERQVGQRWPGSVFTAAWFDELFWDGRSGAAFVDPGTGASIIGSGAALEAQALEPPVSRVEMAHDKRSWTQVVNKLATACPLALATDWPSDVADAIVAAPDYPALFAAAFAGDPTISSARVAQAIATYQRTLVPDQTPWDAFAAGDSTALTADQQQGLFLFNTQAACATCHPPPLFSNGIYHNIGLRPVADDRGRQLVTGNPLDAGRFKTPSLRNAGLRRAFMHNGALETLTEVVEFYNDGGEFRENLDPRILPRGLDALEIAQIVDFLANGLTDPRVAAQLPPFDRPTLRTERPLNPETFEAAHPGTGGISPQFLLTASPNIGNADFKMGIHDALGGARAILAISREPGPPGQERDGVPVYVALSPAPARFRVQLSGDGTGQGFGTAQKPIPDNPSLVGETFHAQWFVKDSAAIGGLAATSGAHLTVY